MESKIDYADTGHLLVIALWATCQHVTSECRNIGCVADDLAKGSGVEFPVDLGLAIRCAVGVALCEMTPDKYLADDETSGFIPELAMSWVANGACIEWYVGRPDDPTHEAFATPQKNQIIPQIYLHLAGTWCILYV